MALYRVLLVDDDPSVLETTAALLEDDFIVEKARSGNEALSLLAKHGADVVCADYRMPGMDGIELLRRVSEMSPSTTGVLVTGHREYLDDPRVRDLVYAVLLKPFDSNELIARIRHAADRAKLASKMASVGKTR